MPTYRTDDPERWGTGKGERLTPNEVDRNFYELRTAINTLINDPLTPNEIANITAEGNELTFHLMNGDTIGPISIPVLQFHYRGDWTPDTLFETLDVFRVESSGLYAVLKNHISASVFDPAATDAGDPVYLLLLANLFSANLVGATDKQIIRYNGISGEWENVNQKYLVGTNFNGVMGNNQDLLHHKLATAIEFPANFADYLEYSSGAGGTIAATGSTTVTVAVAPGGTPNTFTDIGTMVFAGGAVVATLTTVGGVAKAASKGDILRIRGPATGDATLAGFYCILVAKEV